MTRRRALLAIIAGVALAAYVRVHVERRVTGPAPPGTPRGAERQPSAERAPLPGDGGGTPAADDAAPAWEPAPLTRLASWVPAPPATPEARIRAYLSAAPLTLAGLAVGLVSGVAPRVHQGVLLFEHARGPVAGYLRARRFAACTLGHVIIATAKPSPALLAHELVHVRQAERLGLLMAPLYLALLIVYGYRANPLERAARLGQRRAVP